MSETIIDRGTLLSCCDAEVVVLAVIIFIVVVVVAVVVVSVVVVAVAVVVFLTWYQGLGAARRGLHPRCAVIDNHPIGQISGHDKVMFDNKSSLFGMHNESK